MAAARGEADAQALERIAALLAERTALDREALAARLRATVLHLVGGIVGEAGIAPERLAARIDAAAQLIADASEAASLRLHPDDLSALQGRVPPRLLAIADAGMERGGFRLETRTGAVEDGPAAWLAQLAAAIDRAPLPADGL
jgi:flagellar assembly protein FliH